MRTQLFTFLRSCFRRAPLGHGVRFANSRDICEALAFGFL